MRVKIITLILILSCCMLSSALPFQTNKAKIQIEVLDRSGRIIEGAIITIYSSEEDYLNASNILITGNTDKKGRFQYKGLAAKPYFLDVRKDNLRNAEHSVNTGALSESRINKFLITIN